MSEGVFIIDEDFTIIYWNRVLENWSQLKAESLQGKNLQEQFPHFKDIRYRSRIKQLFDFNTPIIFSAQLHYYLIPCPLPAGGYRMQQTIANTFISEEDAKRYAIFTIQDVTEAQNRLREYLHLKEKAEEATEAKGNFLSMMSHEIRTPLNAIIGLSNLLKEAELSPDQNENLETLQFSAEHLLNLVNDILDFSKIEAQKLGLERIKFNLNDLLRQLSQVYKAQAQKKGINLRLMLDDELPTYLYGDPTRLNQILTNLIGNAIKFTDSGAVIIEVLLNQKTATWANLRFSVQDTGIGIAQARQAQIMESFTQGEGSTSRRFGGTGLGLSITRGLLKLMGSQIQLKSEEDRGSQFFFDIQLDIAANTEGVKPTKGFDLQSQIGAKTQAENISKPEYPDKAQNILIVEDNAVNQMVLQKFLKKWGYSSKVCNNGKIAWEDLVNAACQYQLILLDLEMPVMDGYTLIRFIREQGDDYLKHLPVLALSANVSKEVQSRVMDLGFNEYITKPFNPEKLRQSIRCFLK